ncbi:MAG: Hsp70 family protein [Deltaproteobacteria bacterium]|nr:Hsp70 family protein [Deltaproteobacteria bacterium]
MRLGIDFGTTRSIVAFSDRGNYPVVSFMNESGDATDWYPSVVAECSGEFRYGFDALHAASDPSWTLLRSFKRILSDPNASPYTQIELGKSSIAIGQLLTDFLRSLRHDILVRSNLPRSIARSRDMRAMVATPANAHSTQRFLTIDAFRRAGFDVAALLNEPSAAGFEYAHRHRSTITSRREYVVVYDLGGGTFDASLVHMTGQHHDVMTTAGAPRVGGDDFDTVLVDLVLRTAAVDRASLPKRALDQLTDLCRQAKESLNPNSRRVVVELEPALGPRAPVPEVAIPVADFYEACMPLVERTIETMLPVMATMEEETSAECASVPPTAQQPGGSEPPLADIAGIYVVGGASALPIIGRALRTRFGRRVHRSPYPSAATAIGLAIAGDEEAGFALTDRYSRTFGVFREELDGARVSFDPIFTNDLRLPEGDVPFVSCRLYRPAHNIGHFRYIECGSLDADGSPQGNITPFAEVFFPFDAALRADDADLSHVPICRTSAEGPLVRERYALDSHGIVELTITDLDTGYERVHRLST